MHSLAEGCNLIELENKEKRQFYWLSKPISPPLLVIFGKAAWHIGRNLR